MAPGSCGKGVVLIGAGDVGLAGVAAQEAGRGGADVLLLHRPGDEAVALGIARRVEAEGRRCELLAGDLDDPESCEEAAIHAAFLGGGGIGALIWVGAAPDAGGQNLVARAWPAGPSATLPAALRQDLLGFWAITRAVLPHLAPQARVLHLLPVLPAGARAEAAAARRAVQGFARGVLATLRRDHGVRGHCAMAGPVPGTRHVQGLLALGQRPAQPAWWRVGLPPCDGARTAP